MLHAFDELGQWAAAHPEETAKLNAASSGVAYQALLRAEQRHTYGLQPISGEIPDEQQHIADACLQAGALPHGVETRDAFMANATWHR